MLNLHLKPDYRCNVIRLGSKKGLRLRLNQGLKSEPFVLAKSGTLLDFRKGDSAKSKFIK